MLTVRSFWGGWILKVCLETCKHFFSHMIRTNTPTIRWVVGGPVCCSPGRNSNICCRKPPLCEKTYHNWTLTIDSPNLFYMSGMLMAAGLDLSCYPTLSRFASARPLADKGRTGGLRAWRRYGNATPASRPSRKKAYKISPRRTRYNVEYNCAASGLALHLGELRPNDIVWSGQQTNPTNGESDWNVFFSGIYWTDPPHWERNANQYRNYM